MLNRFYFKSNGLWKSGMLESFWMGSFISQRLCITSFCRERKKRSVRFVPSKTWTSSRLRFLSLLLQILHPLVFSSSHNICVVLWLHFPIELFSSRIRYASEPYYQHCWGAWSESRYWTGTSRILRPGRDRLVHPLLQNSSAQLERDWMGLTLQGELLRDAITSKRCQRCRHVHDKCEPVSILISNALLQLYEGIPGHRFELHALLKWVLGFWVNEKSGIGQTDDAALIHGIEIVRTVAVAVRAICSALDCLIKSHGRAHTLVDKRGGNAVSLSYILLPSYTVHLTFREV